MQIFCFLNTFIPFRCTYKNNNNQKTLNIVKSDNYHEKNASKRQNYSFLTKFITRKKNQSETREDIEMNPTEIDLQSKSIANQILVCNDGRQEDQTIFETEKDSKIVFADSLVIFKGNFKNIDKTSANNMGDISITSSEKNFHYLLKNKLSEGFSQLMFFNDKIEEIRNKLIEFKSITVEYLFLTNDMKLKDIAILIKVFETQISYLTTQLKFLERNENLTIKEIDKRLTSVEYRLNTIQKCLYRFNEIFDDFNELTRSFRESNEEFCGLSNLFFKKKYLNNFKFFALKLSTGIEFLENRVNLKALSIVCLLKENIQKYCHKINILFSAINDDQATKMVSFRDLEDYEIFINQTDLFLLDKRLFSEKYKNIYIHNEYSPKYFIFVLEEFLFRFKGFEYIANEFKELFRTHILKSDQNYTLSHEFLIFLNKFVIIIQNQKRELDLFSSNLKLWKDEIFYCIDHYKKLDILPYLNHEKLEENLHFFIENLEELFFDTRKFMAQKKQHIKNFCLWRFYLFYIEKNHPEKYEEFFELLNTHTVKLIQFLHALHNYKKNQSEYSKNFDLDHLTQSKDEINSVIDLLKTLNESFEIVKNFLRSVDFDNNGLQIILKECEKRADLEDLENQLTKTHLN